MVENMAPVKRSTMLWVVIAFFILLLLGGLAYLSLRKGSGSMNEERAESPATEQKEQNEVKIPSVTPNANQTAQVKTFTITAANYSFTPAEIKVKKNDKVKIVLQNNNGFHDWVIDEFHASTKRVGTGQTDSVEFIADKAGTFEFYCSVDGHRQMGMKGNLRVE